MACLSYAACVATSESSITTSDPLASPVHRWNAAFHLLDGVCFTAGIVTFSGEMVIPRLISDLSRSDFLLGLTGLIWNIGFLLPQIIYVKQVEGLAYKKPAVFLTAVLQRLGWYIFFASLFMRWSPGFTLPVWFVCVAINSVGSGMISPIWSDWFAKTVPQKLWSRLLGARYAVPSLLGIGIGKVIQEVIRRYQAPERYRILVFIALCFYTLSLVFLLLVKEERHEGLPNHGGASWRDYFEGVQGIISRRADFRRFLFASLLLVLPTVVLATYLTKYALTQPGAEAGMTGVFTMWYFAASAAGAMLGGWLTDHKGALLPLRIATALAVLAVFLPVLGGSPEIVSAAWCMAGVQMGLRMAAFMPAVFKLAGPHRRPTYTAVWLTVLGLGNAVVPPLFGWLLDEQFVTYQQVFALCAVFTAWSCIAFWRMPQLTAEPEAAA